MAKMRGIVVYLKMGIVIWFIIVYTVNHCIQWTETVLWVEFRVYALSINDMFAIMYNIQFYCISYLRITNNQTTLQFSILSTIPYYLPIIPILISPGIHSISQQTNKQTNKQHKFHLHLMRFSLASLHHLQNSLFILHLTLSFLIPHSHSCSSSCTPPPNPAASSACLPAASPPADRTPPPSPTFHSSPSPTFPTIISCSKLDISNDVYTFISGAFSATFAPCLDSSLRLSYTPGRIAFSSSGVGRCSSLRETPRESLLLLHRGLLELHVQLLLFRLQTRGHLVYR